MVERKAPLSGGNETYIDMIEREMEGGVSVQFPLHVIAELFEHTRRGQLGGLIEVEDEMEIRDLTDLTDGD